MILIINILLAAISPALMAIMFELAAIFGNKEKQRTD